MQALILDTETTDKQDGQPIEIAYINIYYPSLDILYSRDSFFKPTKPIALGAKATHHILESDLENEPSVESEEFESILKHIQPYEYIIGHNCDFDLKVLGLYNKVKGIDTLAIARYLFPDLDSHTQSALMYYFFGDSARDLIKNAHNALCDVENCYRILKELIKEAKNLGLLIEDTLEELWLFSEECRIPTKMHFGKYHGQTYKEVARLNPEYFSWWRGIETPPNKYEEIAIKRAFER